MDFNHYERKINDVIMKCPIEAGVEILVYNLIDSTISSNKIALVDINRIRKNQEKRLETPVGIPDIAVVSEDFEFKSKTQDGNVYGFVEVKATNVSLEETVQLIYGREATPYFIYTNGLMWKCYKNGTEIINTNITTINAKSITTAQTVKIDENSFIRLVEALKQIDWSNKNL